MTGEVRVAVIGTGRIADEHLDALGRRPDVDVVAVCDLDGRLAERAARLHGAAAHTDVVELLAVHAPQAVHITTPPHSHVPLALQALDAGCRLVVLEKPAALDTTDLEKLLTRAADVGAVVVEDQNYRFNAPVRRLAALLATGRLGVTRSVEVRMSMRLGASRYEQPADRRAAERMPGGVLHEFLPHLCYLGTWLLPEIIECMVRWDKRDPATTVSPDHLDVYLGCKGGVVGSLRFESGVAPATTTITVRGTEGWASADLQLSSLRVSRPRGAGDQLDPLVDLASGGMGLVADTGRALMAKLQGSPIYEGIGALIDATYIAWRAGVPMPVLDGQMLAAAVLADRVVAARP